MNINKITYQRSYLFLGDALALALVTLIGFASHGTLDTAGMRFFATYLPMLVSWLLVAPFMGVYDPSSFSEPSQLWRPFWSMILAAPLGAFFRGLWLSQSILPTFVLVMGGVSALGILVWRTTIWFLTTRKNG